MKSSKIFCVGLHKTATTSLKVALETEGYRVARYFGIENPFIAIDALPQAFEIMQNYDAAQDDPWYLIYKELDKKFPNSKFILTTRNSKKWYKSAIKHFGGQRNTVRAWFYGKGFDDPIGHEEIWIQRKEKHEQEVRDYFKDRPQDFVEMDITAGDAWNILGPFLAIDKRGDFPKINTVSNRLHHNLWVMYAKSTGFKRELYKVCMKFIRITDPKAFKCY